MARKLDIRVTATDDSQRVLRSTERTIESTTDALERLDRTDVDIKIKPPDQSDLNRVESKVRELEPVGAEVGGKMSSGFQKALDKTDLSNVGASVTNQLTSFLTVAGPIGAAIALFGDQFANKLNRTITGQLGSRRLDLQTEAMFGLSTNEARRIGDIAGLAFAGGFGEGLEEAQETAARFITALGGIDDSLDDTQITRFGLAMTEAFSTEPQRNITAIRTAIDTGLAPSVESAFDLITSASGKARGEADELLELFNEYAPALSEIGFTGGQAMALVNKALESGSIRADQQVDSLKEVNVQLKTLEGRAAARSLDLDPDRLLGGGIEAQIALATRIRDTADETERASLTQQFYATTLEGTNFTDYVAGLEEAARAADDASGAAARNAETLRRSRLAADDTSPGYLRLATSMRFLRTEGLEGLEGLLERNAARLAVIDDGAKGAAVGMGLAARAADGVSESFDITAESVLNLEEQFADLEGRFTGESFLRDIEADFDRITDALDKAEESAFDANGEFNRTNEIGRNLERTFEDQAATLLGLSEGLRDGTVTASEFTSGQSRLRETLIATATQAGATRAEAEALADEYLRFPSELTTRIKLQGISAALADLDRVQSRGSSGRQQFRATGGPATGPTIVGEQGPELVDLPAGSRVFPAGNSRGGNTTPSAGGAVSINQTFVSNADAAEIGSELMTTLIVAGVAQR